MRGAVSVSNTPSASETIHARVPAPLAEQLKQIAEAEHRSLSGQVHHALADYVKAAERKAAS